MKNKLFIMFLTFFILVLFVFNSFSFASDNSSEVVKFSYDSTNFTFTLPSGYGTDYNYYVFTVGTNHLGFYLNAYLSTFPFSLTADENYIVPQSSGTLYIDIIRGTADSFTEKELSLSSFSRYSSLSAGKTYSNFNSLGSVLQSNFNIYDTEGELVFQPPLTKVAVLPKISQAKEIPRMMGEILTMIIPIGLIVFSIGLVIYLTRLVISRLQ